MLARRGKPTDCTIEDLGDGFYRVQSGTQELTSYLVNAEMGCCECVAGLGGRYCKHLSWVAFAYPQHAHKATTAAFRQSLAYAASGTTQDAGFYMPLRVSTDLHSDPSPFSPAPFVPPHRHEIAASSQPDTAAVSEDSHEDDDNQKNTPLPSLGQLLDAKIASLKQPGDKILQLSQQFARRLAKIRTTQGLESALASFASQVGSNLVSNSGIRVNAKSVARRKPFGGERPTASRPKRPRDLGAAVASSHPNAKPHGAAH